MGWTRVIDIILIGGGVYFLYAWVSMKKTGEINRTVLLGNNYEINKCKDKEAYMTKVMPKVLLLAIITIVCGVLNIVNDSYINNDYLGSAACFVFLIAIIWYAVTTGKAARQYFS